MSGHPSGVTSGMSSSRRRYVLLNEGDRPRKGSGRLAIVIGVLVIINLYVFLWRDGTSVNDVRRRAMAASNSKDTTKNDKLAKLRADGRWNSDRPERAEKNKARWINGKVKRGDGLGRILAREGFKKEARNALLKALNPHMDFKAIRAGQKYRLRWSNGQLLGFEFHFSKIKKLIVHRNKEGVLVAETSKAKTDIQIKKVGGVVHSSLSAALKAQGEDGALVGLLVDVFAYDLNFYVDTHKGDQFRMIVEKEFLEGQFLRYGRVLAAEYIHKRGTARAFYWRKPGAKHGKYYSQDGRSVSRTLLKTPLKYARISSRFNPRRMHPVLHKVRAHMGVDYAAPTGTPVWAAADGKIAFRGRRRGGGNVVILRHPDGLNTLYMHLSKFRKGQRVGQKVRSKTVIGYVGATGLATGPHLHFSVKKNGAYVDPMRLKMSRGKGVAKQHREAFDAEIGEWVAKLASVKVAASGD